MIPYVLTFSISLICIYFAQNNEKNKYCYRFLIFLAILIPSILAGLRDYSIGRDVLVYGLDWFQKSISSTNFFEFIEKNHGYSIGYGYGALSWVVSRFTENPHIFFFLLCFLELTVLYFAIKPFSGRLTIGVSFFLYFFAYYNDSLNILRQFPAILIVLFSYRYIVKRRFISFLICILLAYAFHSTAVAAIVLYPLSIMAESKSKNLFKTLVIIASVIFILGFEEIFSFVTNIGLLSYSRFSGYLFGSGVIGGRYVRILFFGFLLVYFIYYKSRMSFAEEIHINTLFFYCIISFLMSGVMLLGYTTYVIRMLYYFDFYLLLYIPALTYNEKNSLPNISGSTERSLKISLRLLIIAIVFVGYWLLTYIIRNGAATYPYMFFRR